MYLKAIQIIEWSAVPDHRRAHKFFFLPKKKPKAGFIHKILYALQRLFDQSVAQILLGRSYWCALCGPVSGNGKCMDKCGSFVFTGFSRALRFCLTPYPPCSTIQQRVLFSVLKQIRSKYGILAFSWTNSALALLRLFLNPPYSWGKAQQSFYSQVPTLVGGTTW